MNKLKIVGICEVRA